MVTAKLRHGAWVVVCSGGKALFLENKGDEKFPNLQTRNVHQHANALTHEQGADAPGRVFASVGTNRSAVEQTDWHEESERAFLRGIARHINEAVAAGLVKSIFLVAPPRALGILRDELSRPAREALEAELDRDFTNLPNYEIEKRLVEAITKP